MRRATKRRVRVFLWLVLAGALIGAAYGGVVGRVFRETGLIGGSKREIVFHGDVMNTAARLEQATRDLDRPFLVSAEALGRLDGTEPYAREALGPRALRGREAPVEIHAVTAAR